MLKKTKGELEAEICQAMIRYEKEFMGRGPLETRTYLMDDLVLVRLKGVLTVAEMRLASDKESSRSRYLLKQVRQELMDRGRPLLETVIQDVLGVSVKSVHTDISTKTGERVIVFSLEKKPKFLVQGEGLSVVAAVHSEKNGKSTKGRVDKLSKGH